MGRLMLSEKGVCRSLRALHVDGSEPKASGPLSSFHWRALWGAWGVALFSGLLALACWLPPVLAGLGPNGRGSYRPLHLYLGVFGTLTFLASLSVGLVPHRWKRRLAVRLIVLVSVLMVSGLVGDLTLTLWSGRIAHFWYYSLCFSHSQNVPDRDLVWKRRPGLVWRGRKTPDCDEVVYRTDERGFRNPPGIRRADIVVIGDSVTEAGEVAEELTFVQKMGNALGLVAVNLGTSGYGPQQELGVLERYGFSYQPRLVVWQVTEWNDVLDANMYRLRDNTALVSGPSWSALYARHSPLMRLCAALLPRRLPSLVDVDYGSGHVRRQAFWPYHPHIHTQLPEAFAEMKRVIAAAFTQCQERGISFVVVYVPLHVRVLIARLRFKNTGERDRFCPGGVPDHGDHLAHAMARFCAEIGCPMIDLYEPLRARAARGDLRLYVPNDPHLDVNGHDEVSRALTAFVASGRETVARKKVPPRALR